jgi:hypothetical protein
MNINIGMKSSQTMKLGLVLGGVVLVAYLLNNYSSVKGAVGEGMEELGQSLGVQGPLAESGPYAGKTHSISGNAQPTESIQGRTPASQSTYSESTLSAGELLPKGEIGASWAAVNPASALDLKGQNFLQAGYHTNTAIAGVAQTNRNASHDVRSEMPNPQGSVGPFLNSTIEPNPFKRGLEA